MSALKVALALAVLAGYAVSAYGWGRAVCRASSAPTRPWAVVAGLGLGAVLFVGGILNLLRIATPRLLDAVVVAGWAVAAVSLRRDGRAAQARSSAEPGWARAAAWMALLGLALLLVVTRIAPRVFNFHDDYATYFTYPARMLQTGTLFAHPLSGLGRWTLGGQAFLQGFALSHFPFPYLNAVDAVFAALLCGAMLVGYATSSGGGLLAALAAVGALYAINPQYLNTSALYLGSALAVALILLTPRSVESLAAGSARAAALPAGLLYAALLALKFTFAPFVGLHAALSAVAVALIHRSARVAAALSAWLAGWTLLFLAPWVALHAPHYLSRPAGPPLVSAAANVRVTQSFPLALFDPQELFYGDSRLAFTVLGLSAVAVAVALGASAWRGGDDARRPGLALAAGLLGGVASCVVTLALFARMGDPETGVRYAIPVLIGTTAAAWVLAFERLPALLSASRRRWAQVALAALVAACLLPFLAGARQRTAQALEHGSILAFRPTMKPYEDYNANVLNGTALAWAQSLQARVPPGEPIFLWSAVPFLFDFARNPIIDMELGGLTNPWATIPPHRYVLWDYEGYAVLSLPVCEKRASSTSAFDAAGARTCVEWNVRLARLRQRSTLLYDDGGTALFRTPDPP